MQSFKTFGLYFTGLVTLLFINACKDPDNVGLNVLPASDLSSLSTIDTSSLITSVVREDSLISNGSSVNMLGAINDNVFGYSNASFYAQVLLSITSTTFGTNPVLDSIVLTLDYAGSYGDTTSTHNLTVYELDESILTDSFYYSNKTFATKVTTLGTLTTSAIFPHDSVQLGTVKTSPHLRIKLDDALGQRFLTDNVSTPSNFVDNTSFLTYFKGIYLRDVISSGSGSILFFGPAKAMTKLSLFYKNDTADSLEYAFTINGAGRVNHFEHDYTTAVFGNTFPVVENDFCYVQSMAGVKTKVEMPYLTSLYANGTIAINKAELIITLDNTTTSAYPANTSLFLVGIDSTGKSYYLPDWFDSPSYFGGTLSSNTYTFIVTRYVQQILTGARKDFGLYIVSPGGSANAYRTVIGGSTNAISKMKLRLTYTRLNP